MLRLEVEGGPAPGGMWEWTEEGRTVLEGRGRGRAAAPSDWAAEGDPARPLEEHSSEIAFVWPCRRKGGLARYIAGITGIFVWQW